MKRKIRDASEKLMVIVGTVQLLVIPQGTCIQYRLCVIVTISMTCSRGLLGFPILVSLGLISGNWVTKDHPCKAKVTVGALGLPRQCENSTMVTGSKTPTTECDTEVTKILKLSEAAKTTIHSSQRDSVKILNINKHGYEGKKNVKFNGDMREFF